MIVSKKFNTDFFSKSCADQKEFLFFSINYFKKNIFQINNVSRLSSTKLRGSASPTSTTSSTSGHSSGGVMPSISTASQGDLSSSPASSVTSGSTRSHKGSEGSSSIVTKKSHASLHIGIILKKSLIIDLNKKKFL